MILFVVVAQLSPDAACYRGDMRCTDSSSISDCNVIADNRSWLRRINHRYIGHGVDNRRSNVSSPAVVRIDFGEYVRYRSHENEHERNSRPRKLLLKIITNACVNMFCMQGVHTMLPISWPVSVVLAVILSVIHLGCRIASSVQDYLFLQTVRVPLLCFMLAASIFHSLNSSINSYNSSSSLRSFFWQRQVFRVYIIA